jgi:hypothetical protein
VSFDEIPVGEARRFAVDREQIAVFRLRSYPVRSVDGAIRIKRPV